jgi:hypothetical protein
VKESQDQMIFGDRESVWIRSPQIVCPCHKERGAQVHHVTIVQMIRIQDSHSQRMAMRVGVDERRVFSRFRELLNCVLFEIFSEGRLVLGEVPMLARDHQNRTVAPSATIFITKRVHP